MNRRDFLHKSTMAALVASGLPKGSRVQNQIARYESEVQAGMGKQWYYDVGLSHNAIRNFGTATDAEKVMGMKIIYYETADKTQPAQTGEYKFIITSSQLINKSSDIFQFRTKLDKKLSGNHQFPKDYPNQPAFQCKPFSYLNILDKKDMAMATAAYKAAPANTPTSGGTEDCFLTTACVSHRGLPDDCQELQTLRFLRDGFMVHSAQARVLVDEYRTTGPAIVNAINTFDNRHEIYDYIYRHMILPSCDLVEKGRYEDAIHLYKVFVAALQQTYC